MKPLKIDTLRQLKENWELCIFRITLYQKAKYLSQDPSLLEKLDENMRRWTFKLTKIIRILRVSDEMNRIASAADLQMISELARIMEAPVPRERDLC